LTTGEVTGEDGAILWINLPTEGLHDACAMQALMKLSFKKGAKRSGKVLIDMWFDKPSDWVFNIGDSKSNDGWCEYTFTH
jgi:hypothetical protein